MGGAGILSGTGGVNVEKGWGGGHAQCLGTVPALQEGQSQLWLCHAPLYHLLHREQLSAGKQHLVHTGSELRARWKEAGETLAWTK